MVRSMGAVIAGLVVMLIVVASIQWLGHSVYPPPDGLDIRDKAAVADAMASAPVGALFFVRASSAVATFPAAGTAATVSLRHKRAVAVVIGLVMLVLAAISLFALPHPAWMTIAGLLIPLPMALLGWFVFR